MKLRLILQFYLMPVVKDFLITFRKKSHSACFLPEQTLDFVLHRLLAGLAEMDTDDIGGLVNSSLKSWAIVVFRCVCGLCHRKSSCKNDCEKKEEGKAATLRYL